MTEPVYVLDAARLCIAAATGGVGRFEDRLPARRSRLVGEFLDSLEGQTQIEYLPP